MRALPKPPNGDGRIRHKSLRRRPAGPRILVTGGAGFIGSNLCQRLVEAGHPVRILDNLSRAGVKRNARWLEDAFGDAIELVVGDVRNRSTVALAVEGVAHVFHLAAQVAVTTSLTAPADDFDVNLRGTLNLLEALRQTGQPVPLVYSSTNKVYGDLADVDLRELETRWWPATESIATHGISERQPLSFHSPYGCSKGGAEQYVLDYARSFGLPTVVFRLSCIYGPHQWGNEDQGWVAHFLLRALRGEPITIYGDGKQVRDLLYVDDLLDALLRTIPAIEQMKGQVFNLGGGRSSAASLREVIEQLGSLGVRPTLHGDDWRVGDQRYYVSDTRKFGELAGWAPRVSLADGLRRLWGWLQSARREIGDELAAAGRPQLQLQGLGNT